MPHITGQVARTVNPILSFEQSAKRKISTHSTGSIRPSQLWVVAVEVPEEVIVLLPVFVKVDDAELLPVDVAVAEAELDTVDDPVFEPVELTVLDRDELAVPILVEHPAMCGRDGRVAHRPPLERGSGRGTAPCEAAGHRRRCDDSDAAAAIRGRSTTYGLVEQRRQRTAHASPHFPAIPGSFPHARG